MAFMVGLGCVAWISLAMIAFWRIWFWGRSFQSMDPPPWKLSSHGFPHIWQVAFQEIFLQNTQLGQFLAVQCTTISQMAKGLGSGSWAAGFFWAFMAFMETLLGAMAVLGREGSTYLWCGRRRALGFGWLTKKINQHGHKETHGNITYNIIAIIQLYSLFGMWTCHHHKIYGAWHGACMDCMGCHKAFGIGVEWEATKALWEATKALWETKNALWEATRLVTWDKVVSSHFHSCSHIGMATTCFLDTTYSLELFGKLLLAMHFGLPLASGPGTHGSKCKLLGTDVLGTQYGKPKGFGQRHGGWKNINNTYCNQFCIYNNLVFITWVGTIFKWLPERQNIITYIHIYTWKGPGNRFDNVPGLPPLASKGCVVNLMVFSLAKHLQLWVELPAQKEDHMENKLVKCMWLAAACKPSLKSWYPMSWTQTLMYLHGFSSQLAKTWLSIWDLASLSGRRHWLKMFCLWPAWLQIMAKKPCLPSIGPHQDSVPPGVKDSFYSIAGWTWQKLLHGLSLDCKEEKTCFWHLHMLAMFMNMGGH